ncbi:MAG TPA: hypothetical protein VGN17_03925 [Bryobacteraceae bacterium]|jgi:hypothetical protein
MVETSQQLTVSELAMQADINVGTASRKLKQGKSPEQIIEEAQQWRHQMSQRSQKRASEKAAPDGDISYIEAQRLKEIALKNLRELEYQVKSGDLVPVAEVNAWVAGMIIEARNILLRIAPELRDRLCIEQDPAEIDRLISQEVDRVLQRLAEFKPN